MPRKKRGRPRKKDVIKQKIAIPPDLKREILAIGVIILGIFFFFASINLAGKAGSIVFEELRLLFGYFAFFLSLIFIFLGVVLFKTSSAEAVRLNIWLGLVFLLLFWPAFFHLFINTEEALEIARAGLGGGLIGYYVADFLIRAVDFWASFFILLGLVIMGLVLFFNIRLSQLLSVLKEFFEKRREEKIAIKTQIPQSKKKPKTVPIPSPATDSQNWALPPIELLDDKLTKPNPGDIKKNVQIIQKTLADFGIEVTMGEVNVGPTVTQYTLKPAKGVKLNQITARANDLALALAAHPVRIEAPIPGRAAVGVEVPNKTPALVRLREMLETTEFNSLRSRLAFMLGRDVAGKPVSADLAKMPHLLIAGATGSGKSICIHSLILTLLYRNSPQDLRLLLIDPKRVELPLYEGIPHLICPVIVEADKAVNALKWAIAEMERRYQLLSEAKKKDIELYNETAKERLPYLVIVIDELADLMATSAREVESAIVRLAQLARATGIHLVVATQRPSVDVITGLIKANITARIAFAVASQVDSRTILDMAGAEKLLGNGDMLFVSAEISKPKRIQGIFVSEKEIKNVVEFITSHNPPAQYNEEILTYKSKATAEGGVIDDELYEEAKRVVIEAGRASASLLQRRLRIGYARAARLLDMLEEQGVVSPPDGAKPRKVLITPEEEPDSEQAPDSSADNL